MQKLCIIMHFEKIYTFVHSFFALKIFYKRFSKNLSKFFKIFKKSFKICVIEL